MQDRRTFDLKSGIGMLDFTDVAASIDSTSVSFKSLTDPTARDLSALVPASVPSGLPVP